MSAALRAVSPVRCKHSNCFSVEAVPQAVTFGKILCATAKNLRRHEFTAASRLLPFTDPHINSAVVG
jgi:hypothetical protein